jgi:Fe-S cluster assembly scaffold protein SufB
MKPALLPWLEKKQAQARATGKLLPAPLFRKGLTMSLQIPQVRYPPEGSPQHSFTSPLAGGVPPEQKIKKYLFTLMNPKNKLLAHYLGATTTFEILIIPRHTRLSEVITIQRRSPLHHLLIVLEEGAQAHLIDQSDETGVAWHGAEIFLEAGAHLTYAYASVGERRFFYSPKYVHCASDASLTWIDAHCSSAIALRDHQIALAGEGSKVQYASYAVLAGAEQMQEDVAILHNVPRTYAHLHTRSVLLDQAKAIIEGKMVMTSAARQAEGFQDLSFLTLGDGCVAGAIPLLEIAQPEVKCSHACRISTLDQRQLFYLMTRGLCLEEGKQLIVEGYLEPLFGHLPHLRQKILSLIHQRSSAEVPYAR